LPPQFVEKVVQNIQLSLQQRVPAIAFNVVTHQYKTSASNRAELTQVTNIELTCWCGLTLGTKVAKVAKVAKIAMLRGSKQGV
jgi:hypothetical protein